MHQHYQHSVSQIPNNKPLKEQKATKSVRDYNPDGTKQAASKKGVSASLRERETKKMAFVTTYWEEWKITNAVNSPRIQLKIRL